MPDTGNAAANSGMAGSDRQDQEARFENYGAGQPMIGTVLMLLCGLPAIIRSL
jgi:hypothetical protein